MTTAIKFCPTCGGALSTRYPHICRPEETVLRPAPKPEPKQKKGEKRLTGHSGNANWKRLERATRQRALFDL